MGSEKKSSAELVLITQPAERQESPNANVDYVDKYAPFIIRGSIITAGIVGVSLLARSLRIFTRFHHAREIPTDFIRRNMDLRGAVSYVRDDSVLQVKHQPAAQLPKMLRRKVKGANLGLVEVKLAGLEIGEAGHNWIFKNLLNKPIVFNLIKRNGNDYVSCEVLAKKAFFLPKYSVNKELVRRGLARVHGWENSDHQHALRTNPSYARLVHRLVISEQVADSRGVGIWRRDSWAERLAALPSQTVEMVRNTGTARALAMTWRTARDLAQSTYHLGRGAAATSKQLIDSSASIGRSALDATRQVSNQARAATAASVVAAKQIQHKTGEVARSPVAQQIWKGSVWITSGLWTGVKKLTSWITSQRKTT